MVLVAAVTGALVSTAAAQQRLQQQTPQHPLVLGVPAPERVAGLPRSAPHDFETKNPGWGYALDYAKPGWAVNVYIYDRGLPSIPDDVMAAPVQNQLASGREEILELQKRGDYKNVTEKDAFRISDSAGRTRFICKSFNYFHTKWERTVESYLCLTAVRDKFFKIRMTTEQRADSVREVRRFAEAWLRILWQS
jgi:hypothetical protein